MLDQFDAPYIGMANMYAMPVAVGGVDFPGKSSWRRPTDEEPTQMLLECKLALKRRQVPAARVDLFDFLHGTSRHILGQFRRNWSFIFGLFNLYFRNEINSGTSLRLSSPIAENKACDVAEEDVAVAAGELCAFFRTWRLPG